MIERKIVHVLSHNIVMAHLSTGKNSIAFGKGIGFKKTPGMIITESEIKQEFLLHTSEVLKNYEQILNAVDVKIIGITEEVIANAQGILEGAFSETIHASLVDHINFAVERQKRGTFINNPFTYEIQYMYPEEYKVAKKSVDFLNEHLGVKLPEDEIAFLAMHFKGARDKEQSIDSFAVVRVVSQTIEAAKELGFNFDDSFSTLRFISHLKGLIERVKQKKTLQNSLLDKIKEEYGDTYVKAKVLSLMLSDTLNVEVPDDETGYLTMHLERLLQPSNA
ncbi:PRD domain-containing protein [Paenibacillus aceris]|uniref:Transcriptional antiterminator n=1 Tax=Paenibacillus aceris TaxID=869555 RepID=A0ABS4I1V8_9BACL|nr:PRD domain-containing protein [Paenibacillus aceris]MBP1964891.1 transcriptional antiterminator [Paenibacillus aceris]NHW38136.1 PRD domain-containing protein [Paenibacillus aceris]